MIKLGKLTDYAVAICVQLGRESAACSAHHLAGKLALPEPTVAKVLKALARQGLVESQRGAMGGYRLARPADGVSVCDVVEALEGPIAIVSCATGKPDSCRAESVCPARDQWTPVNQAVRAALQAVRISDMARASSCAVHGLAGLKGKVVHAGIK
jgi:FeS assembly SUF system regulator